MINLSIVIPAYNEENAIASIVRRVLAVEADLAKCGIQLLELLVVDDGSKDKTAEITSFLARKNQKLRLIQHQKNKGYGSALKTGFSQSQGELIGFLDADGTYPPEFFPSLCKMALNGSDLVIGSRMAGEKSQMPITRRIGNLFFAGLLSLLGRQAISDSASGMRVFKREILERLYPLPDGLNLTPVMSTRAIHEGIQMAEVPIPYQERVGRSKLSVVRDGSLFLQSMIWTVLSYNPVRILGILGLSGVILALLFLIGVAVARIMGVTELGAWGVAGLFWAMVSLMAGISIFALGATFNYLVSLFYTKPIRQGLFGRPVFTTSIDYHFGWIGLCGMIFGLIVGVTSMLLGVNNWEITRLWFYLLGSAMLFLTGMQLVVYWILMRILEELSQRTILIEKDLENGLEIDVQTELALETR
jgi:glycosyltransferase involved in cell wall biosynthesis